MISSLFTKSSTLLALAAILSAPAATTGQVASVMFEFEDSNSTDDTAGCQSITDVVCDPDAGLKALCEALAIAELNDDLDEDAWTIFAPTDEAFEALGRDNLDSLVYNNNTVPLVDLLLFHVVPGVALTSDLLPCEAGNNLIEMANGEDSRTLCEKKVTPVEQRGQYNDKADAPKFIEMDILACNGVVHVLDKVMLYAPLPNEIPTVAEPNTVVSPPRTPEDPVGMPEEEETEPPSLVVTTGATFFTTTVAPEPSDDDVTASECQSISEIACSTDGFTVLCGLLQENGFDDDLSDGLWTVFAPTDEAFDEAGRFDADTDISYILLGHVVPNASIMAGDLVCTEKTEMANGRNTRTVCKNGTTYQKGGGNSDEERPEIITTDIEACNGVVHVVDRVILT